MDNNANIVADPTATAVNAANNSTDQRVKEQIEAINNSSIISGQPNRANLKPSVSNSLDVSLNNPQRKIPGGKNAIKQNPATNRTNQTSSSVSNGVNKKNNIATLIKQKMARNAIKAAGVNGAAADKALNSQQGAGLLNKRKGLFARLFSGSGLAGAKDQAEKKTSEEWGIQTTLKVFVRTILLSVLIPTLSLALILFISLFVIFAILDNLGLDPDDAMNTSASVIEKKLDNMSESDAEKGAKLLEDQEASLGVLITGNSIYSIKLSKANVAAIEHTDFTIDTMDELYPSASNYGDIPYSKAFFYKLYSLNKYYLDLCGKQKLDIPLLVSTLRQESDDMSVVFKSNIGVTDENAVVDEKYIEEKFSEYYKYNYDWSGYEYLRYSSLHDMEILAQHMVKVYSKGYCKYDEQGYKEFLQEFIEKKYFLSKDLNKEDSNGKSAKNFTKYDLTEDQLLQIASLCQREQGSVIGAAAEASLMANKFEINDEGFLKKYPNDADAFYHYVRELGWWANAAEHMDKRNATKEVIEAVKDVLVYGKRTLPKYVNSHDCINCNSKNKCPNGTKGDICSVKNYNVEVKVTNKSNYISHVSQVSNVYGSKAIFYAFPTDTSDPFSYKDKSLREKYGECHYDMTSETYVDCVDFKDTFVEWLIKIATDDRYGYSQAKRDSLIDFDCSSFVYYGLINNGFTVNQLGSQPFTSATEREILINNGFKEITISGDYSNLEKGDILWRKGYTEVYIGEGLSVGAHSASNGTAEDGERGDQNGKEISVVNVGRENWTYAYRYVD